MTDLGFALSVDRERDIVVVRYTGLLSLGTVDQAYAAIAEFDALSPSTMILLDASQALVHEIDVAWLRRAREISASHGLRTRITALVVALDEGHQMLGQLWAAIRATNSNQSGGVFTDQQAAVEWLLDQRSAGHSLTIGA